MQSGAFFVGAVLLVCRNPYQQCCHSERNEVESKNPGTEFAADVIQTRRSLDSLTLPRDDIVFLFKKEKPRYLLVPGFPRKGLERREVEKRIYGVERFAAHGFRVLSVCIVPGAFEQPITELKTKIDFFVNKPQRCLQAYR